MLKQEVQEDIVRIATQAVNNYESLTDQAKMDTHTKFKLNRQKTEEAISWLYSQKKQKVHH